MRRSDLIAGVLVWLYFNPNKGVVFLIGALLLIIISLGVFVTSVGSY